MNRAAQSRAGGQDGAEQVARTGQVEQLSRVGQAEQVARAEQVTTTMELMELKATTWSWQSRIPPR